MVTDSFYFSYNCNCNHCNGNQLHSDVTALSMVVCVYHVLLRSLNFAFACIFKSEEAILLSQHHNAFMHIGIYFSNLCIFYADCTKQENLSMFNMLHFATNDCFEIYR